MCLVSVKQSLLRISNLCSPEAEALVSRKCSITIHSPGLIYFSYSQDYGKLMGVKFKREKDY